MAEDPTQSSCQLLQISRNLISHAVDAAAAVSWCSETRVLGYLLVSTQLFPESPGPGQIIDKSDISIPEEKSGDSTCEIRLQRAWLRMAIDVTFIFSRVSFLPSLRSIDRVSAYQPQNTVWAACNLVSLVWSQFHCRYSAPLVLLSVL